MARRTRAQAEAERDRLREIVERLPRTADGMVVNDGLEVWWPAIVRGACRARVRTLARTDGYEEVLPRECYSTPELAEAARAAKDKP